MQYMTRKGTTGLKSAIIGAKRNMCNIHICIVYCVLFWSVYCVLTRRGRLIEELEKSRGTTSNRSRCDLNNPICFWSISWSNYSQTCFDGFHDWSFHRFTWNYSSQHNAPIERIIPGIDCLIHSRSDNMNTTRERQTIVKRSMAHIAPYSIPYTKYFRETFYTALYQSRLSLQDWLKYTNHIKTQVMLVVSTNKICKYKSWECLNCLIRKG